jgi:hypothetical protein
VRAPREGAGRSVHAEIKARILRTQTRVTYR